MCQIICDGIGADAQFFCEPNAAVGVNADSCGGSTEIDEQIRLLDGLVRYRFGDNAELMGAWISARNEVGSSKSHIQPNTSAPETPTEVQPNVVKPAA